MGALHPTEHHGGLMAQYLPTIDFTASPTLGRAFMDSSYFVGVEGPPGSGKTTWSIAKLMYYALQQEPDPANVRRTRWAVIRNTFPELKSTTIRSWEAILKPEFTTRVVYSSPIEWHYERRPYGGQPGLDILVYFLALDNASDVRKLKSLEITGAWINEATEIVPEVLEVLTTRCGRYPSIGTFDDSDEAPVGIGATWQGIIADTNAGDDDNWWHRWKIQDFDETLKQEGRNWSFYRQPPAVLECHKTGTGWQVNEAGYEPVSVPQRNIVQAAGRFWCTNPNAENRFKENGKPNLDVNYYEKQLPNKTLGFIQRFLQVKTIYLADGKPWVPEFSQEMMVASLPYDPKLPLFGGIDIGSGTLQPAAVIGQRGQFGDIRVLRELPMFDIGTDRFSTELASFIATEFGVPHTAIRFSIDPAGDGKDGLFETSWTDHLKARKFNVAVAFTNNQKTRREAMALPMGRLVNVGGKARPGLMIDRSCTMLIAGLAGKWNLRRIQVAGIERYHSEPEKNKWSNVCDALGYFCLGIGEGRHLTRGTDPRHPGSTPDRRQVTPSMDFSPFGGNVPG
jgi:hypothetical protein